MESQIVEYKEYPHSKNLAFAFYKAGFIESWGRGWKKICDGFVAAGLPKPTIESKQGGVLVTFQRNNVNLKNADDIGQNKEVSDTMSNKMSNKEIKRMENNISENIAESIVENIVKNYLRCVGVL